MARLPLTEDDAEEIEATFGGHSATAEHFEALAAEHHPDDEVSPALLLVKAGEQWDLAEQPDRARDCFRRAVADGREVAPDTRCYLLGSLLSGGLGAEAAALAVEIKADRPKDPFVYEFVGECYEEIGDLREATRWFTAGMVRVMRDDDAPEFQVVALMQARWRVRRAQGFPPDDYDELVLAPPNA